MWRCRYPFASIVTLAGFPGATPAMPPLVTFHVWLAQVMVWASTKVENRMAQIRSAFDMSFSNLLEYVIRFFRINKSKSMDLKELTSFDLQFMPQIIENT